MRGAGKILSFAILALMMISCGRTDQSISPSEWPTFGHDASNNKFSLKNLD